MKAVGNNILNGRKLVLPLRLWRTNTPCHPRPSHVPGQTHSNCDSQNNRANVSHYISVLNTLDALPCVYCVFGPLRQPNFVHNCLHKCTTPALFQANSSPIGTISTAGSMIPTILSMFHALDALLRDYRVYRPVRQPNFVPLLFHLNPTSVGRRAGSCCP